MLRDFINKRSIIASETMRNLAKQCTTLCDRYSEKRIKAPEGQLEPRPLPKLTEMEEVCHAKCESKMMEI